MYIHSQLASLLHFKYAALARCSYQLLILNLDRTSQIKHLIFSPRLKDTELQLKRDSTGVHTVLHFVLTDFWLIKVNLTKLLDCLQSV